MTALDCRCCGRAVNVFDGIPIHTSCIPRHWGEHAHGKASARCREFGKNRK